MKYFIYYFYCIVVSYMYNILYLLKGYGDIEEDFLFFNDVMFSFFNVVVMFIVFVLLVWFILNKGIEIYLLNVN